MVDENPNLENYPVWSLRGPKGCHILADWNGHAAAKECTKNIMEVLIMEVACPGNKNYAGIDPEHI